LVEETLAGVKEGLPKTLKGAEIVVIPAGLPRKVRKQFVPFCITLLTHF
jgi:malate/lactate dehydrogenase